MKKLSLLLPFAGLMAYLTLSSNSTGLTGLSTVGCNCHGSNSTNTMLTITGIPASGWQAGTAYPITATVSHPSQSAGGFNLSVTAGALSNAPAGTQLQGTTEIKHTTPKTFTSNAAAWTFTWTAPMTGSTVTFNMAGNAVNLNGQTTGDAPNVISIPFQKAVVAPPTPTVNPSGSNITGCAGRLTLTATAAGATSYQWFLNNNAIVTQVGPTLLVPQTGSYTVTATNTGGTSAPSAAAVVTFLFPVPSATFTVANNGALYTFTPINPTAGATYLWTFGTNGPTASTQIASHQFTGTPGPRVVKLRVTGQGGCADSTTQTINVTTTGIGDMPALAGFRFGPNPASGNLLLNTGTLKADVRLLDLTGKVVANLRSREEVSAEKTVSLAQIAAGLYFLEVTTNDARGVEKLLVK